MALVPPCHKDLKNISNAFEFRLYQFNLTVLLFFSRVQVCSQEFCQAQKVSCQCQQKLKGGNSFWLTHKYYLVSYQRND